MQLITFTYNAGTKPGNIRKVYLTQVGDNSFTGYDFTAKGYRQFSNSQIASGSIKESVNFDWLNFKTESDKVAAIAELENRGLSTFVDETKSQVVGVAV